MYGPAEHELACSEIATILKLFGDGTEIPCEYARSFFLQERPADAGGLAKRRWWSLGLLEIIWGARTIKSLLG